MEGKLGLVNTKVGWLLLHVGTSVTWGEVRWKFVGKVPAFNFVSDKISMGSIATTCQNF